ncbi:hypothetical protein Z947_909 [Sulfitobacter geojensis]|nr:hypothetical protein Z947_909 [Sulfitobacter geojensis]
MKNRSHVAPFLQTTVLQLSLRPEIRKSAARIKVNVRATGP